MTDERDARARQGPPPDATAPVEVVPAAGDEPYQAPTGQDSPEDPENGAANQVERDHLHERRPQTPHPDLAEAKRERDEYLELAQRTKADFENYRRRVARETAEALARGKADLARQLLPALDNLERALATGSDPSAHGALVEGVAMVRDELHNRLAGAGVEAFDPTGEKFDPELHEALSTMPQEGTESGVVLETLEKGYRLNGQVLRAAKVVVSQ